MWLFIIFALIAVIFILKVMTAKWTENVPIAFAGAADGSGDSVKLQKDRNRTIYTEGDERVDLSNYERYYISGHSLEKAGIADRTLVYAKPWKQDGDLSTVPGRFVIFSYDKDRQMQVHPDKPVTNETLKIRRAVYIVKTNLPEQQFLDLVAPIVKADQELSAPDAFQKTLWQKYSFASDFYKEDKQLIMSITYRNGEEKDYSFHSPRFLKGIVEYKSAK
jgi:hypothetical protein